jgi:HK97 family phage portal protein
MKILSSIRELFAVRKQFKTMVNLIDMWQTNRPLAPLWDVARFVDEGYRRNSVIYSCINLKTTAFAGPEMAAQRVSKEGDEIELSDDHMLSVLLGKPNKVESQSALMRSIKIHLEIAGNAYVYKVRNAQGMPIELRLLRPDLVRPIISSHGEIAAYAYGTNPDSGVFTSQVLELGREDLGGKCQVLPAMDVIHEINAPDPLCPWVGLSPMAVLARMGDLDNFACDYLRAFFLNSAIPAGILTFKTQVNRDERERAREIWKERYGLRQWDDTGIGGHFDVAVMDSDVDYKEIGTQNRFLGIETVFGEAESRICGVFGVHPILIASWIGLLRSTMANYEQARRSLYSDSLLPSWISIADRFTVGLAEEFGSDIEIKFKLKEVPELQKDTSKDRDQALAGWKEALLTRNEARQVWGLDEDPEGDVYKDQINSTAIPSYLEEEAGLKTEWERHAKAKVPEWKKLQQIASKGEPALKKKFLI